MFFKDLTSQLYNLSPEAHMVLLPGMECLESKQNPSNMNPESVCISFLVLLTDPIGSELL